MSEYVVVTKFRDAKKGGELQIVGRPYDVTGVDDERISFLLNPIDKLGGHPAIELVEPIEQEKPKGEYPKHVGGGWYELSDGEKVQGKENAIEAENELISDE